MLAFNCFLFWVCCLLWVVTLGTLPFMLLILVVCTLVVGCLLLFIIVVDCIRNDWHTV